MQAGMLASGVQLLRRFSRFGTFAPKTCIIDHLLSICVFGGAERICANGVLLKPYELTDAAHRIVLVKDTSALHK